MQEDRDIPKYDYITYMQRYIGGQNNENGLVNGS